MLQKLQHLQPAVFPDFVVIVSVNPQRKAKPPTGCWLEGRCALQCNMQIMHIAGTVSVGALFVARQAFMRERLQVSGNSGHLPVTCPIKKGLRTPTSNISGNFHQPVSLRGKPHAENDGLEKSQNRHTGCIC
jgi:hypothetical protein